MVQCRSKPQPSFLVASSNWPHNRKVNETASLDRRRPKLTRVPPVLLVSQLAEFQQARLSNGSVELRSVFAKKKAETVST